MWLSNKEGFNGNLVVEKVGKRLYKVSQPFETKWATVPIGFTFDGASVPRIAWFFMDTAGEAFEASCVHDYLLYQGKKKEADRAFKEVLEACKVKGWKVSIAYAFVKAFSTARKV
jgi:hypothetical protein